MQLQNDVFEIKTNVAEFHFRQMQFIENVMATGGAGRVPAVISRGHAILVDATGREHTMFLDQCRHLDVRFPQNEHMHLKSNMRYLSNWMLCSVPVSFNAGQMKLRSKAGISKGNNTTLSSTRVTTRT